MKILQTTKFKLFENNNLVRFRKVQYEDEISGVVQDYEFQVFKRPYFFGSLGKKRWSTSIISRSFRLGVNFSLSLV